MEQREAQGSASVGLLNKQLSWGRQTGKWLWVEIAIHLYLCVSTDKMAGAAATSDSRGLVVIFLSRIKKDPLYTWVWQVLVEKSQLLYL